MKKKLLTLSVFALALSTLGLSSCYFTIDRDNGKVPPATSESTSENISSSEGTSESTSEEICTPVGPVYRVYFHTGGGEEIAPKEVAKGGTCAKPKDPVNAGKTFEGWYTNSKFTGTPFDFTTPINNTTVLYAKWGGISSDAVDKYNAEWLTKSKENHLYIHYLRFNNTSEEYKDWDVWSWPFSKDGTNFDFVTNDDGSIYVDDLGGAYVDIDLTKTHEPAGWLLGDYVPGLTMSYMDNGKLAEKVGFQIVKKSTRQQSDSFWENDGDDNFVTMSKNKWENGSYHVFAVQNNVPNFTSKYTSEQAENPYENDDGTNVSKQDINSSNKYSKGIAKTSQDFLKNAGVGYQVMVASFADSDNDGMGDIYGITKKLQYLKDNLHINTLWLTPIQLSDSYHAYDIIDYKIVDPKFGSKSSPNTVGGVPTQESAMQDYVDLLNKAEELGIRVVMDLVINHTSKKNTWFLKSSQLDPDYRSFYQWKRTEDVKDNKNWHTYSTTPYSYYGKFASSMPELNYDYQGTRDAMVDVASFWMDKGVDGFRIDAVKHIYMADEVTKGSEDQIVKDIDKKTGVDYSSNMTKNVNFFQEFNYRIKEKNPNALILGENFDGNALNNIAPYYAGLDSLFDFYMYYKMSNIAIGNSSGNGSRAETIAVGTPNQKDNWSLPGVLAKYDKYREGQAIDSVFTSNHDVPRALNMMAGTIANADDQTAGTITSSNAAMAIRKAKLYSTVMLMTPGISWIYYGDELGMSSNYKAGEDKNSPHVDRWYRQPYKFGDTASGTADSDGIYQTGFNFTGGAGFKIEYDEYNKTQLKSAEAQLLDSDSMLNHYKKLTELKSSYPALISGSYKGIKTNKETVFAFERTDGKDTFYIYVNFGASNVNISMNAGTQMLKVGNVSTSQLGVHSAVIVKA